jgi:hypothetical protein
MNILKRNSTTINIATFWENHQLGKYNYDPPYQRPSDVWSEEKQSFLIDTILKNFPMPPIFLHQHIDDSGKTMYDVIDGKQRLGSIIAFIQNKLQVPEDFSSDGFGEDNLCGLLFKDFEKQEITYWKKIFWRYEITIEYIDTDQLQIVNNIFDRLNRNGEPLTRQELRNAKYHDSSIYKLIKNLSDLPEFKPVFKNIQVNRLENHEIVSELLFALMSNQILSGDNQDNIDSLYVKQIQKKLTVKQIDQIKNEFTEITKLMGRLLIKYSEHKVDSLSHLYAHWYLAKIIRERNSNVKAISGYLDKFYIDFRKKLKSKDIDQYKSSMMSNTKSKSSRTKRVNALLSYCKQKIIAA